MQKDNIILPRVLLVIDFKIEIKPPLRMKLNEPEIELIDYVIGADKALKICAEMTPDLVIIYINRKYSSRRNLIKKIKEISKSIKVLVFSFDNNRKSIALAIKDGADGFVFHDETFNDISSFMDKASKNITFMNMSCRHLSLRYIEERKKEYALYHKTNFTVREKDVWDLVAEGLSNFEISEHLGISAGRVRNIVADLLIKCMVQNRTQLAVMGIKYKMYTHFPQTMENLDLILQSNKRVND